MSGSGNRVVLPAEPLKCCARCLRPRGNVRNGWSPLLRDGVVIAWSCPECPRLDEPISRLVGKRGGISWRAVVTAKDATGKWGQTVRRFAVLEDARAWVRETREAVRAAAIIGGRVVDPSKLTVAEVAERWIESRRAELGTPGGIRAETHAAYESALKSPLKIIGDRLIREVTKGDVEAMLRQLLTVGGVQGRPLARRSVAYALLSLRQSFEFAEEQRPAWLHENVAKRAQVPGGVQRKKPDNGRVKRWSAAQLVAFREAVEAAYADPARYSREPWVVCGMRLALCGLRRSEVLGLDWSSVDRKTGAVTIVASRTKTGVSNTTELNSVKTENSHRTVQAEAIHPGTTAALRRLWLAQGRPTQGLVIRDAIGEPVQPDLFSRKFRAMCVEAGIPPLTRVHNTRHSVAVVLDAAGVPAHQAASLLGHDTMTYTRFYLVTDADGAAAAAVAAGKLFAV